MQNRKGTWVYKRSQTELLLEHFNLVDQTITPTKALKVYGIERLAGRIWDLEQKGHVFDSIMRKDAMGKRYKEYVYMGKETIYGATTPMDMVPGGF